MVATHNCAMSTERWRLERLKKLSSVSFVSEKRACKVCVFPSLKQNLKALLRKTMRRFAINQKHHSNLLKVEPTSRPKRHHGQERQNEC